MPEWLEFFLCPVHGLLGAALMVGYEFIFTTFLQLKFAVGGIYRRIF